jgi:hypothetical protein
MRVGEGGCDRENKCAGARVRVCEFVRMRARGGENAFRSGSNEGYLRLNKFKLRTEF